jgi:hypothetical protein
MMKKLDGLNVVKIPFFNEAECKEIIKYAHKKEKYFIKKNEDIDVPVIYSKNQVTTANYASYNFFEDNPKYIERLLGCFKEVLPWLTYPISLQSWVNIYKTGEGIGWHNHNGLDEHSYTANIFLGGVTKPGVNYTVPGQTVFAVENVIGEMLLSNCSMWHMVTPNESNISRYSVGITIHDYESFTKNLVSDACFNSSSKGVILLNEIL